VEKEEGYGMAGVVGKGGGKVQTACGVGSGSSKRRCAYESIWMIFAEGNYKAITYKTNTGSIS
jgi:hypothetical protein